MCTTAENKCVQQPKEAFQLILIISSPNSRKARNRKMKYIYKINFSNYI